MSGFACLLSWVCFKKRNIHLVMICQSPLAHGPHCSRSACVCLVQVVHALSSLYSKVFLSRWQRYLRELILLEGLHKNITPTPKSFASEPLGLLSRKTKLKRKYHSKKIKDSYSRDLPNHVHSALQKWALVTQEKMASPLDFNTGYSHYWSADS